MVLLISRLTVLITVWFVVIYGPAALYATWDRRRCAASPDRVVIYVQRARNGHAFYVGETNDMVRRTSEHTSKAQHTGRGRSWKWAIDGSQSTIARYGHDKEHALRIERRMILALSMLARLGAPFLGRRYVGNVEHNRKPHGPLEAVWIFHWLIGYALAGLVWREAALVLPWTPGRKR